MTNIEWTVENQIQLFYAMMNHKPIGINKHFQMVVIHDNLTSSLNCELNAKEIWKKLETLYDLRALDESDKLPFPNNEEDFSLPEESFASLMEGRGQHDDQEEETKINKSKAVRKEDSKDEALSTPVLRKEKREVIEEEEEDEKDKKEEKKGRKKDEDEERETPRRGQKRARELNNSKNSPSPAATKRRR